MLKPSELAENREVVQQAAIHIMAGLVSKSTATTGMGRYLVLWDTPQNLADIAIETASALVDKLYD